MSFDALRKNEIEAYGFTTHSSGATGVQKQKSMLYTFTGYGLLSEFFATLPD